MPLNTTQSTIIQAAGNAVLPPAGTIIAQLANFFGIRGKTQHLSYPESDAQATQMGVQVFPLWKANLTSEQYRFISQNYLPRLFAMLTVANPPAKYGDWWNPETLVNNVAQANSQGTDLDWRVDAALYFHFFWILFHEDVTRVQESVLRIWRYQITAIFDDRQDLLAEVQKITGTGGAPIGGTNVPGQQTLTQKIPAQQLLLVAGAGLAAFLLLGKPK